MTLTVVGNDETTELMKRNNELENRKVRPTEQTPQADKAPLIDMCHKNLRRMQMSTGRLSLGTDARISTNRRHRPNKQEKQAINNILRWRLNFLLKAVALREFPFLNNLPRENNMEAQKTDKRTALAQVARKHNFQKHKVKKYIAPNFEKATERKYAR
uniref:Uncharacterized protein n=1 Tax=Romanomermis culicivorax TaxID=13658 RepID=A0A915IBE2_ROMCU